MFSGNVKMAIAAVRSSKWRSTLTMLGIIIGVVSVVIAVSLGEGVKHQVVGEINRLGSDLITIRPGKLVNRDSEGRITKVNFINGYSFNTGSLPANDLAVIQKTQNVNLVVPISIISGGAKVDGREYNTGYIVGTNSQLPDILKQKIAYGDFFTDSDGLAPAAILGRNVALKLFNESAPIGQLLTIHGQEFVVRGVFDTFQSPPLALGPDFNNAVFIPYGLAQQITGGNSQLIQVLVRPSSPDQTEPTIAALNQQLLKAHGQQEDFTVLRQDENLAVTNDVLNLLTGLIAGIAAISLLVGGIGIMNIMLVSVTERTREIGVRKAVGATNKQILSQFLVEALVLCCFGSLIGLATSGFIIFVIRVATHLQPVITWPIVIAAMLVSIGVGVLFGLMPAAKAARKDPIDALRFE